MLTSGWCQGGLCFYFWNLAENRKQRVCRSHISGKNRLYCPWSCQSEVVFLVLGAGFAFDLWQRKQKLGETKRECYFIQTLGKQQGRSEKDRRSNCQMLTNQFLAAAVDEPRYRHSKPLGMRVTPTVESTATDAG